MNLININTKELLKLYFTKKEIAYKIIDKPIKFTNKDLDFDNIEDLDFVIYTSDFNIMLEIKKQLVKRLNLLIKAWTKQCYYYNSFEDYINYFDLSLYNYKRLLKLSK